MKDRSWVVARLPSEAFRLSRLARDHPGADVHCLHLGLDADHDAAHHRFLLRVDGDGAAAWDALRRLFQDDLRARWDELAAGGRDAVVVLTEPDRLGARSRDLLALWPKARLSCLRCRGDRTDLYALAASPGAAGELESGLHDLFDTAGVRQRHLDAEEQAWCSRLLDSAPLMAAMDRQ